MKVLVTGGAGFIGSHLCEALLNIGDRVVCLDNFYTGSMDKIEPIRSNSNFAIINGDVIGPLDIEVDQIYNLACPASPVHYQKDPVKTLMTCADGVMNMLELSRKNNCKFLQASTSEVYGDPLESPQKETYFGNVNPVGKGACYDEGKRIAETLVMDFRRVHGLDVKIARIFNTYGPKMGINDGRVVSNFIAQALRGEAITVYGDGQQTRSFCYVSDMIDGLIKMMNSDQIGPINLGNPEELPILDLAKKIIELTGSNSKIVFKELPEDDPKRRRPDITLARERLSWEPRVGLEEGLTKTIEYFNAFV